MRMPGSAVAAADEPVDDDEQEEEEDGFDFALENLTLEQGFEN